MTFEDALELVLALARHYAISAEDKEACNVVEDYIVNQLGEDTSNEDFLREERERLDREVGDILDAEDKPVSTIIGKIDLPLLVRQKQALLRALNRVDDNKEDSDLLNGVLNLLDCIHDQLDPPDVTDDHTTPNWNNRP